MVVIFEEVSMGRARRRRRTKVGLRFDATVAAFAAVPGGGAAAAPTAPFIPTAVELAAPQVKGMSREEEEEQQQQQQGIDGGSRT